MALALRRLLVILFLGGAALIEPLPASHLVGGDLTYTCLGKNLAGRNVYEISLNVYRDCQPNDFFPTNTPFDRTVNVFVLDGPGGQIVEVIAINLQDSVIIDLDNGNPCVPPPDNLCYTTASYITTIELDDNPGGYHLAWGRCCRNETIQNIFEPGEQGLVLYAFIPGTGLCNNSPVFNNLLPTYICLSDQFSFDHSATDADGDSLAYRLTVPFTGGSPSDVVPVMGPPPYQNVVWQPPYGPGNIMSGVPPLAINPVSGQLTVRPGQIGQFVFSVTALEYRNGQLISELKRDIQINVIGCPINFPPEIGSPTGGIANEDTLKLRSGEEACFSFEVVDVNGPGLPDDEITVSASGSVFDPAQVNGELPEFEGGSELVRVSSSFCWTPSCELSPGSTFSLYIRAEDQNPCPAPNVVIDSFVVLILPTTIETPDLRCVSVAGDDQITLNWIGPPASKTGYAGFEIERNDGSGWLPLATLTDPGLQTWTDQSATGTGQQVYCYRLRSVRDCPNEERSAFSQEVCSIVLSNGPVQENSLDLVWNAYDNWPGAAYDIGLLGSSQPLTTGVADTTFLLESCDLSGRLVVRLTDPVTGCEVRSSATPMVVLRNDPPPVPGLCAAGIDTLSGLMEVSWETVVMDDFERWELYRRRSDASIFDLVLESADASQLSFKEAPPANGQFYCYQLVAVDACGSRTPSPEHCTIALEGSTIDEEAILNWNAYSGWAQAADYELFRRDDGSGWQQIAALDAGQLTFTDRDLDPGVSVFCYRVRALNVPGACAEESWSPETCLALPARIFIPNAFSPNGDGQNDLFEWKGFYLQSFQIEIFNQWGNLVYRSTDPDRGWDGRDLNGRDVPEGVYMFRFQMTDFEGTPSGRSGSITLFR